jgi:hypothetical protein
MLVARICEVCGRIEEMDGEDLEHDLLDVCSMCTNDRYQFVIGMEKEVE